MPIDTTTYTTLFRRLTAGVGIAGTVVGGAAPAATRLDVDDDAVIIAAPLAPPAMIATAAGAAVAAFGRRWTVVAASLTVLGLFGWSVNPLYVPAIADPLRDDDTSIRIMQANLLVGSADPDALVTTVHARGVDVPAVPELTTSEARAFKDSGLEDLLPHHFWLRMRTGAAGLVFAVATRSPIPVPWTASLRRPWPPNCTSERDIRLPCSRSTLPSRTYRRRRCEEPSNADWASI
ncbi:hypothetical protein ABH922_003987 [Rhodococcus sp. 27YEA15]|uniref:hypothetical protein n=1 Tax=Rhodococcus sp. 27YEA15 TaxID=3156259 RepID=UPI003C7DFABE